MQLQSKLICHNSIHYFALPASPPKTLSLDEVMDSARDLSNLSFAHEIIVNRDFHLEPNSLPQDRYTMSLFHKNIQSI